MKIYIDNDCKCHVTNDGTMREFDMHFFDGKCPEFIEGYRYVPEGERWIKPNGECSWGGAVFPWKHYSELEKAQMQYELAQYEAALLAIDVRQ